MKIIRNILSIVLGYLVGVVIMYAFFVLYRMIYPIKEYVNGNDQRALKNSFSSISGWDFLWILNGVAIGSFVGGVVSTWISGREKPTSAIIVGTLMAIGGVMASIQAYNPVWFTVLRVLVYMLFVWIGYRVMKKGS